MSLRSNLGLPREHGAWAMFYVPFVLGILVAGRVSLPVLLLLLATSTVFISRESGAIVARLSRKCCGEWCTADFVLPALLAVATRLDRGRVVGGER